MAITEVTSADTTPAFEQSEKYVLYFYAAWHTSTTPNGVTYNLLQALSQAPTLTGINKFYAFNAEECPTLSEQFAVTMVPTFVLLHGSKVIEKLEGVDDAAQLTRAVQSLNSRHSTDANDVETSKNSEDVTKTEEMHEEKLRQRLISLISSSTVMLFMKGNPKSPRCGFSRQAIEILSSAEVPFGTFDILGDEEVRQSLKTYSDWPTYPQLYVNGELIGGLDILKELAEEEGGLKAQLGVEDLLSKPATPELSLDERLKELTNRHKVMLFMKGLPSQPRCGFSRQICEILNETGASYDAFDILSDEEVRQGLKNYSDWPTYPQLYVDGDLIGGLDIVKEMVEGDELKDLVVS